MRGNRRVAGLRKRNPGSIPAHAGQPRTRYVATRVHWVYPRSRGATNALAFGGRIAAGLSPLTRGNRCGSTTLPTRSGSIPAHAGQPGRRVRRPEERGVYPRSRGATTAWDIGPSGIQGLSPLTRGNPRQFSGDCRRPGSIPAHAGQPPHATRVVSMMRVYPRSRGATVEHPERRRLDQGLSPLTRGNPARRGGREGVSGSIPAHAGQPALGWKNVRAARVYPRSRGATDLVIGHDWPRWGLSPLTRGNPRPRLR